MALSNLEIECVMGGRNFQNACAELGIDRFVGDDRKFFARQRTPGMFAEQIGITLIAGMSCHSCIGHDRFGPSSRDFNETSWRYGDLIANVVKASLLRFGNDFLVRERSLRRWVPIDHATTAIDQPFFIEV